jgi:hypothetical protein
MVFNNPILISDFVFCQKCITLVRLNKALLAIQQNLGHTSVETTQGYIGTLHVDARKPSRAYSALGAVYRKLDKFNL